MSLLGRKTTNHSIPFVLTYLGISSLVLHLINEVSDSKVLWFMTNNCEESSCQTKVRVFLLPPLLQCRCGTGRHLCHWCRPAWKCALCHCHETVKGCQTHRIKGWWLLGTESSGWQWLHNGFYFLPGIYLVCLFALTLTWGSCFPAYISPLLGSTW